MLDKNIKSNGGFVVDCNHGGGICGAPPDDIAAQWKFCKEHPFGVSPDPYDAGLPRRARLGGGRPYRGVNKEPQRTLRGKRGCARGIAP